MRRRVTTSTHKLPESRNASETAFKKLVFSSEETPHSLNHLFTSAADKCKVFSSSLAAARRSRALHTTKRAGEVRGVALNKFARLYAKQISNSLVRII